MEWLNIGETEWSKYMHPADEVEDIARLDSSKTVALALVVQPRHEALEDVEGRQSAYAAAVERQQAEAGGVKRGRVCRRAGSRGASPSRFLVMDCGMQGQINVGRTGRVYSG